ncbi:MAG TPA: asparagine synthase (glutamine-hydrolyzing) [Povalibacter sp.]|nr:asparagine synthase (glutamine-hydrolyzing) [Povalibacter sp.]
MCGFVAVLSLDGKAPDTAIVERMTELLAHRGPDDSGSFAENGIALGFRRLAILDLAPSGHQPMFSADGRYVIVFNGEIYNFVEIRRELQELGHQLRSSGDTEVLLAAYLQWGKDCLHRLNGMWAFVIYDRVARTVFGARDRFGVKPMFSFRDARSLVFASEIKAIRDSGYASPACNWNTIAAALAGEQLDAGDDTFYQGITRVPAGCAFTCDAAGRMTQWKYWSLAEAATQAVGSADPVACYRELFDDAVRLRMRSDVPLGVLLSGGLDSTSIIASMAGRQPGSGPSAASVRAFCYMDPLFDESAQIQATLQQTQAELTALDIRPHRLWSVLEKHLWHQDEPVHSFTSVVGYELMALARSHGVKVLLNGQGADEVLAGYANYYNDYWAELLRAGRWWAAVSQIRATAAGSGRSALGLGRRALRTATGQLLGDVQGYRALAHWNQRRVVARDPWLSADVKRHWQWDPVNSRSLQDALLASVERTPLPLYLRVEDRNSMAHGVEVRLPFLDYRLVTLVFGLGAQWKLSERYTKVILREAMAGRVPEIVRTRVHKFGFPTGIDQWLRGEIYEPLRDLLSSRIVRESGLWNMAWVDAALEQHRRGVANFGPRLFDVAQMCLWMYGSAHWPHTRPSAQAAESRQAVLSP